MIQLPTVLAALLVLVSTGAAQTKTTCIAAGDLDGDGALDLVFGNEVGRDQVFRNIGKGRFEELEQPAFAQHASDSRCVVLGDVDGDGDLDVVFGSSKALSIFENKGKAVFVARSGLPADTTKESRALALLDVDADKDLDLVVANFGQKDDLFLNDGKGKFTPAGAAQWPVRVAYSTCLSAYDFDADGDVDILLGSVRGADKKISAQNQLMLNDGKGGFRDGTATGLPKDTSNTSFLLTTRRKGKDGVAVIQGTVGGKPGGSARMRILESKGPGLTSAPTRSVPGAIMNWTDGLLLDFDGDGDEDLYANNGGKSLVVCTNDYGVFRNTSGIRVKGLSLPEGIAAICAGDVDGDGKRDLIVAYAASRMVLRGTGGDGFAFDARRDLMVNRGDSVMATIVRHRAVGHEIAPGLGPSLGRYRLRLDGREKRSATHGATTQAIELGLEWLAKHQDKDGRWDSDGFMKHDKGRRTSGPGSPAVDVGVTGLALLALLGDGHSSSVGKYRANVERGLKWLREQQLGSGLIGMSGGGTGVYEHSIATQALCEAYCMSGDGEILAAATKAVKHLEKRRNPYACWRYQPRDNDNDISVTVWAVQALIAAQDCRIEAVNKQALKIAANFVDELTDASNGRCGYTKKGEPGSRFPGDHATRFPLEMTETLTAVGLLCRFSLGQDPAKIPVMRLAADTVLKKPPVWDKRGRVDHYYWYHATNAMYRMGGKYWKKWSAPLTNAVIRKQSKDGSWDPDGVWGEAGGRVYSTAILVLTLEAPYRFAETN